MIIKFVDSIDNAAGSAQIDDLRLVAIINIPKYLPDKSVLPDEEIEKTIVHEFLHCHLAACSIILGTREHDAEERAVEVLTRVMVEGFECKQPQ